MTYAESDVAMGAWNRRAQLPPATPAPVYQLAGFTTKALMRGEMVHFELDRTGILTSDKMRFNPDGQALMLKPRE